MDSRAVSNGYVVIILKNQKIGYEKDGGTRFVVRALRKSIEGSCTLTKSDQTGVGGDSEGVSSEEEEEEEEEEEDPSEVSSYSTG